MNVNSPGIAPQEYQSRQARLVDHLHSRGLNGAVLFDNDYILYYCGFAFIPTERPIAFLINTHGDTALFVPRLETEHAKNHAQVLRVDDYIEYPYIPHPMQLFVHLLQELKINTPFGADQDGYPWILGYRGAALSELTGFVPHRITAFVEDQMMIKSPAELGLIRESVKWSNLAHSLLQRYTRVGVTETEAAAKAGAEANRAMLDAIGPLYRAQNPFQEGPAAGYRGQIGRNAAIPHALASNLVFQPGDVLVSGAATPVWGYTSELERTMIIGPASEAQKFLFDHMLAVQELAMNAIRPGRPCSEIDRVARAYYEEKDLLRYWKHHVGHAIGLRYHEAPFLDIGDQTIIQPGMVFTVEPGLYSSELGGFRHSDTVVVTEQGVERLTYYPRDLASLTIAI